MKCPVRKLIRRGRIQERALKVAMLIQALPVSLAATNVAHFKQSMLKRLLADQHPIDRLSQAAG